jgi:23S rRNA pseudouridine1911/1915/1917 synthase
MPAFSFHDFVVGSDVVSQRLDKVLGVQEGCSRTKARKLIDAGAVFVNGRRVVRQSSPVRTGDHIRAPEQLPPLVAVDLGEPLHRDRHLLALNKPVGVPAAPTPLGIRGTLPELARVQYGLGTRPLVVHRLDVDVSGVMVLALNRAGTKRVTSWFTEGKAQKYYRALVAGEPPEAEGRIEERIGRDPARSGRMCVHRSGDSARTDYRVLSETAPSGCTALELRLHTGRTHQLRVHLAWLGCPVLGDRWYDGPLVVGSDGTPVQRLCLHSHRLEVVGGSRKGADLKLEAPVPDFLAG